MSIISIGIPIPDRSALPGQTGSGEEVNLQYVTQNYCANSNNPSPTVATPAGGTFSYAPGGISGGANGTIVIANSQPGNYIVTYTVNGDSANFPINISALDDASFSYSASAFCADASNQTPSITTPGGTFTSQDITFRTFQMQFEVSSGVSKTITIPGVYGSSFTIDWGDGFTETSTGGGNRTISHTYNDGTYTNVENPTVSIGAEGDSGPFTSFAFANGGSKSDLIDIPQWGSIVWSSMISMFRGCNNSSFTTISATDIPSLSSVTSLAAMFRSCTNLASINNFNSWDVSNVTSMSETWQSAPAFNQDLNNWDVSNVTNFNECFEGATSFNGNISSWDVSSVTNMYEMFKQAAAFSQDISGWNVGNVTSMYQMFFDCALFNSNISSWNVNNVTNMTGMLNGASIFNQDISGWNVGNVTTMASMLNGASIFNADISSWNTSNVTNMGYMFRSANAFNQDISGWDVSKVTSFSRMFNPATSFNQNLGAWNLRTAGTIMTKVLGGSISMSPANYTDTLVDWANTVYTNSGPYNVSFTGNDFSTKFDATRTYSSGNFSTAQDAYDYLTGATAGWSIS